MLKPFLRPGLDVLFVGFNPRTRRAGSAGNITRTGSLWRILRKSGLAPDIRDDTQLFAYNFGITDLLPDRPARVAREISDADYRQAAAGFRRTLARLKPRVVCLTGKDVFRHFAGLRRGVDVEYDLAGRFRDSLLFVAPFPSGKWMTDAEKAGHYREIRALVEGRLPSRAGRVTVID